VTSQDRPAIAPVTLTGKYVVLEPLRQDHHDGLVEAARDGELWNLWYTSVPDPHHMAAEIERRLALRDSGAMLPFTTRLLDPATGGPGRVIGMTTYMNIDADNRRVEIGSTWYRRRVQRSALNTECKLLLLTHAFERLHCIAVEFRTHFFNRQSRAGIERLGAKLDGILRQHQIAANGTLRDTCVYSIVDWEWPAVKAHLAHELARPRSG